MALITITVTVQDQARTFEETKTLDIESLRSTPNPRQCLVSHFLDLTRAALEPVDPINL